MTCKDCLHFDACSDWIPPDELLQSIKPEGCNKFRNKADYAEVKHGEWLLRHIGHGHYWECSVCHTNPCIYVTKDTKFCPNCGAKMGGERK